jgi:hypothetical protein
VVSGFDWADGGMDACVESWMTLGGGFLHFVRRGVADWNADWAVHRLAMATTKTGKGKAAAKCGLLGCSEGGRYAD